MLFHRRGLLWLGSAVLTFGGSSGIMTTLPYPCSPQAKTRDESSRSGEVM